jgi:1,4-dihydroxy-2-naphthoate polyprenyltransferase
VVNNLRDIETDRKAGQADPGGAPGGAGARIEYLLCLAGAYLAPFLMWAAGVSSPWVMLSWLSLPLALRLVRQIYRDTGRSLNLALAGTGQFELVFAVLFSIGLLFLSLRKSRYLPAAHTNFWVLTLPGAQPALQPIYGEI